MSQDLGIRMKRFEQSYNFQIPPRTYTIIRLDGRSFSKFTKKYEKPFDVMFSGCMDEATTYLCKEFNPKFAYTQSDEISLLFTDIENIESQQMFDGKVQKLCSLTASACSARFNEMLMKNEAYNSEDMMDFVIDLIKKDRKLAIFDARVFVIPDFREVSNYFLWRQQDATKNSISMAAQAVYSHKELQGKNGNDKQDMLMEKGINWNDYPVKFKRGVIIKKEEYQKEAVNPKNNITELVTRTRWVVDNDTPIFTQDKQYLRDLIPVIS